MQIRCAESHLLVAVPTMAAERSHGWFQMLSPDSGRMTLPNTIYDLQNLFTRINYVHTFSGPEVLGLIERSGILKALHYSTKTVGQLKRL